MSREHSRHQRQGRPFASSGGPRRCAAAGRMASARDREKHGHAVGASPENAERGFQAPQLSLRLEVLGWSFVGSSSWPCVEAAADVLGNGASLRMRRRAARAFPLHLASCACLLRSTSLHSPAPGDLLPRPGAAGRVGDCTACTDHDPMAPQETRVFCARWDAPSRSCGWTHIALLEERALGKPVGHNAGGTRFIRMLSWPSRKPGSYAGPEKRGRSSGEPQPKGALPWGYRARGLRLGKCGISVRWGLLWV